MPISSMTGFASTADEYEALSWRWDLKSVNARGLDLRFRLPVGYESIEPKLRATAQKHLKRGSVTVALSVRLQSVSSGSSVDEAALGNAITALSQVRLRLAEEGLPVADTQAEALLGLAGVLSTDDSAPDVDSDVVEKAMIAGFDAAMLALCTERRAEGERLESIISGQVAQIESLTRDAAGCATEAVHALRERARQQIEAVLADSSIAPERLDQEVAVLAVKADVREEIDRLNAHVAAARDLLAAIEPVGRRLDFLTQEFNREANTLCSKSPTDRLTRIGLELKTVIDQLREQAANVE